MDKIGSRTYWEDWTKNIADITDAQIRRIKRINKLLEKANPLIDGEFEDFVEGLRANLNESIIRDDAVSIFLGI